MPPSNRKLANSFPRHTQQNVSKNFSFSGHLISNRRSNSIRIVLHVDRSTNPLQDAVIFALLSLSLSHLLASLARLHALTNMHLILSYCCRSLLLLSLYTLRVWHIVFAFSLCIPPTTEEASFGLSCRCIVKPNVYRVRYEGQKFVVDLSSPTADPRLQWDSVFVYCSVVADYSYTSVCSSSI